MFISFEGMEGSGKSSVIATAVAFIEQKGITVLQTREPGGSALGRKLRSIVLHEKNAHIVPLAELFLYMADRAQHVGEIVRPALEAGKVVVTDRYADSTIVYQGFGRKLNPGQLYQLNDQAVEGLWPDVTFLLDVEPKIGLSRARSRNTTEGIKEAEGRFEAEALDFHVQVREGYLDWASKNPERFIIIDASQSLQSVTDAVLAKVATLDLMS